MGKLIRMDLYRMVKAKSFLICLILAFVLALSGAPLSRLMVTLFASLSPDITETFIPEVQLSSFFKNSFPALQFMLMLLSLCFFFYADVENGYIKNIAGQMPMKGFTILSKFIAAFVHNIVFAAVGIIGSLIGALIVQKINVDGGALLDSFRVLALKLLLAQGICAILLLVVSTFRSKSLGVTLAVLYGLGLTSLIYLGINEGLQHIFGKGTDISKIMPDTVMNKEPLDTWKAIAVAVGASVVFLVPAIRIFDRKDVK